MARRQEEGALEGILDLLIEASWWVSIVVACIAFVGIRFGVPAFLSGGVLGSVLVQQAPALSWFAAVFLLPVPFSLAREWRARRLLEGQDGVDSIKSLSWREFELLLGEALRRQGYSVTDTSPGADGGVDLVAVKDGRTWLVQCKQWRERSVGVKVIREMLGLVTAHRVAGAIVVTSGDFTSDARAFAAHQPVRLIDGDELVSIVRAVQVSPGVRAVGPASGAAISGGTKTCSACGAPMVVREARRGQNRGGKFWGCSSYPRCRHTEPLEG